MAADVQVSEIDILKAYSGKMNGLRKDSIALAALLDRQLRKMQEDYEKRLYSLRRILDNSEEDCKAIQNRYQSAITACGEDSRVVIGNTDIEAQSKVEAMRSRVEMVRNNIQRLQTLLQNAGLKTQNYAVQMDSLSNSCVAFVNRYAEVLQQSKDIKK